jgi:hypothetical protein
MRQDSYGPRDRAERFRSAMREAHRLSAVISRTEYGLLIELSDGRMCAVSLESHRPQEETLATAMQWARRHGAISVEVCD